MTSSLARLIALTLLSITSSATAADKSIVVRTCVYAVPKKVALTLMAEHSFISDPQAAVRGLRGMVAEKKASVAANPSASSVLGTRTEVEGDFLLKFETGEAEGGLIRLNVYLEKTMKPTSPQISTTLTMKRGETQFLGSCDDPSSDANAPTWIVFATVQ